MTWKRHDPESRGSNPRDHAGPKRHFLTTAHRDWRVWLIAVVLIGLMLVYSMTDNEALGPAQEQVPAMGAP
jgi:hypothetical protein